MHDVQSERDDRGVTIDQVGIAGLRYPIRFTDGDLYQAGIAEIEVSVELQADRRGTHMSRMVEITHEHLTEVNPRTFPTTLKAASHQLDAERVTIVISMPISIGADAPVSRQAAWQVHDVMLTGTINDGAVSITTAVTADITSLCPCSKAISDYGAHNQRGKVTLSITADGDDSYPLTVSEIVGMIRRSGSAPVYPLVKRPDERQITMQAFDHPVFVEDIARDLSVNCRRRGLRHMVRVRNLESIHSHDALAVVTG